MDIILYAIPKSVILMLFNFSANPTPLQNSAT